MLLSRRLSEGIQTKMILTKAPTASFVPFLFYMLVRKDLQENNKQNTNGMQ